MKTMPVKTVYLEMLSRPERRVPPPVEGVEVVRTEAPTIAFYRSLYDAVGTKWNWIERKRMSDEELAAGMTEGVELA